MKSLVTVDYSAVERMLPILPFVLRGEEPPQELVGQLLASPGIKVWLKHAGRHGNLTEELYRRIIKAAVGLDQKVSGRLVDYLRKNAARSSEFVCTLEEFKRVDLAKLCDQAYRAANEYLLEPFTQPVNFYLMCATRGSAIVLDYDIAMDIADFPDPRKAPLPIPQITATLAHEIFHMGRRDQAKPWPKAQWTGTQGWAADLLGSLIEEGAATYLFTMENFRLPEWKEVDPRLAAVQHKVAHLFDAAFLGTMDEQELEREIYGMFGSEGYVLGARICQAIDQLLGRDALRQALRKASDFLVLFNQAVEQGSLDIPPFKPEHIRLMQSLGI